ncbi:MAG: TonB-dependent receptor [Sulfurovum sp.]|jgi:iron complex outermembrane receptor protein
MKKILGLSLITSSILVAAQIGIQEEMIGVNITDVKSTEIKNADLAESLTNNIPFVSIVRRSGIANDIILRGAKKDNINILLDDAKIYGACPNRMDPATSHVLTNNIESVEVTEGPYDVENFGTLSGKVKVNTLEPKEGFKGDLNLNYGSFNYKKASINLSGGTDKIKILVSASTESSDQYEDGNGNSFYEQQDASGLVSSLYANPSEEAYTKKTLLTKIIGNIDDSSEIKLSYTANRSDNVLYPNTPMDAKYDDSNIYTVGYTKRDLADFSKEFNIEYYYSNVDHPMDTSLREYGSTVYTTNHMKSSMWGTKVKNALELNEGLLTVGLDTSVRNWKGEKYITTVSDGSVVMGDITLASTDTDNKAMFSTYEKSYGDLEVEVGTRYDYTDIDTVDASKDDKTYKELTGYLFTTYNLSKDTKLFGGLGKSSRVPDARELYYAGSGNDELEVVKNYEADLGIEQKFGMSKVKVKTFYSILEDYIYNTGTFENVNAKIYGAEVSGISMLTNAISIDYGMAYLKGTKDSDLNGDKDLAEIPPLKGNFALNYEVSKHKVRAEILASKAWNSYDENADEQRLGGYAVTNLKYVNKQIKDTTLTFGVDNVFDKTYASTNTYQDVTYIAVDTVDTLLNDPGRYMYVNVKYSF